MTETTTSDTGSKYGQGAEARADAVLSKIFGAAEPSPAQPTTVAATEPAAPESASPAPVADETLTYAGFTPSMQAKLSPEERQALVSHHKAENAKAKAQAERLNELEKRA